MLEKIKRWLEPPVFPCDKEKTEQARVMNTISLYFLATLAVAAIIIPPLAVYKERAWGVILALFILYSVSRILMFKGYLEFARVFLVISIWVIFGAVTVLGGGILSPMIFSMVAVTIVFGLTLKRHIGNTLLAINIFAGLGLVIVQQNRMHLPQFFVFSPIAVWSIFTLTLLFVNAVMNFTMRKLENALARANQRVEETVRQSEERFQMFMQYFPGLAYIKDADGHVIFANQGFAAYLGLDPRTMLGKTDQEVFGSEFGEKILQDDQRVLASGVNQTLEEEFGGRTWTTHKFSINQPGGNPLLGGITLDMTEQKRAEEALHKSEAKFRAVVENSAEGIIFVNPQGNMSYRSPAY